MNWAKVCLWVCVAGLGALGLACDSGGDSTSTPEKGCNTFVSRVCDRSIECASGQGQSLSKAQCVSELTAAVNCSAAVQLGATFPQCLAAVPSLDCTKLLSGAADTLPASCSQVILTEAAPAQ